MIYRFDDFVFDGAVLRRDERPIPLTPIERKILAFLLECSIDLPREPLPPELIKQAVWGGSVTDNNLQVHVVKLRQKLGSAYDDHDRVYIARGGLYIDAKVVRVAAGSGTVGTTPMIRIVVIFVALALFTVLTTVPPRAVLASLGLTTTQVNRAAAIEGAFHGVAGALLWSFSIGLPLLLYWVLIERTRPWKGKFSPLIGAVCGCLGGAFNTAILAAVYTPESLASIHWIKSAESDVASMVTETGLAFTMPIFGLFIGIGSGETTRGMLKWWDGYLKGLTTKMHEPDTAEVLGSIGSQVAYRCLYIILSMTTSVVLLWALLKMMPVPSIGLAKLIGEAISVMFGGFGLVAGIFWGLFLIRKGIPGMQN